LVFGFVIVSVFSANKMLDYRVISTKDLFGFFARTSGITNCILGLTITPLLGIILLFMMIFCGRAFRENWKDQTAGWVIKAWIYGLAAFLSFLIIALIPLQMN
jgi:hypothetical protein